MSDYELIAPTRLKVNKSPTGLWDIAEPEIGNRPIEAWGVGTEFTAKAIYTHPTGGEFYVRQNGDHEGIKVEDADSLITPTVTDEVAPSSRYLYTWVKGDIIWEVARRLKCDPMELMENNGINKPEDIKPGDVLLMKEPWPETEPGIGIELYEAPKTMHVTFEGGTHKVAFGNVSKWSDLKPAGPLQPYNSNVEIVAVAHVPIGDEEMAAFLLDAWALGDYRETGKVAYTIGFNHSHLTDGEYVEPQQSLSPEESFEPEPEVTTVAIEEENKEAWKTTYRAYPEGARRYLYMTDLVVHDIDARRPSRTRFRLGEVDITGEFVKDGITYGRPPRSKTNYHWYGIPMDKLELEDEVHNVQMDLAEKVLMRHHLTFTEKLFEVFSRNVSIILRIKSGYARYKQQKQGDNNG